jgi:hypothetical protein
VQPQSKSDAHAPNSAQQWTFAHAMHCESNCAGMHIGPSPVSGSLVSGSFVSGPLPSGPIEPSPPVDDELLPSMPICVVASIVVDVPCDVASPLLVETSLVLVVSPAVEPIDVVGRHAIASNAAAISGRSTIDAGLRSALPER